MALAVAVVQTAHMHMAQQIGSCTMPASRSPLGAPRMVSFVNMMSLTPVTGRPCCLDVVQVSIFLVLRDNAVENTSQCPARSSASDLLCSEWFHGFTGQCQCIARNGALDLICS